MDQLPFFRRPLPFKYYNATLVLVLINVGVFFISYFAAPTLYTYIGMNPWFVTVRNWWWQVFTYMFAHASTGHLLLNMFGLFFLGTQLERRIGSNEFLLYYLVSGTLAGLLSLLVYWATGAYQVWLVGASGAVFAVVLAYATYFPTARLLVFWVLPVRAPILVIGYTAISIYGIVGPRGGNIAHMTHLAGFAFGYLYLLIRLRMNPIREFLDSRR